MCLRKVAPFAEWQSTTLRDMLAGDDGSAGVLLTLDVGATAAAGTSSKSIIDKAAASLNIKPVSMDVDSEEKNDTQAASNVTETQQISSSSAWAKVLQSNFDSASKSCLLTLLKIIDNILSKTDPRVRTIRYGNPNFQSKVASCKGALQFMYSLGFEAKYAAFGPKGEPESLELKDENRQVLLTGREVLIISAKNDFDMEDEELPRLPAAPVLSAAASTSSTAAADSRDTGFDIYKGHSVNIAAQQMGTPDPYADRTLSTTERALQNLEAKKKNMEKSLQKSVEIDRCLVAYLPGQGPIGNGSAASTMAVESKGDSSLVAARMKRMEDERKKREEGGFTTKAMRDLEKMKKAKVSIFVCFVHCNNWIFCHYSPPLLHVIMSQSMKVYSHVQIRINFPDGTHLHSKFLPTETISTVRAVVQSSFNTNCQSDFELYIAPPRRLLNDTNTLEQEELVPAAKIHVSWKSNFDCADVGGFLRTELFNANNNNESVFPEAKPLLPEKKNTAPSKSNSSVSGDNQSKEELLMARMMGKGLLSGKKKSSVGNEPDEKKGKPKWFK